MKLAAAMSRTGVAGATNPGYNAPWVSRLNCLWLVQPAATDKGVHPLCAMDEDPFDVRCSGRPGMEGRHSAARGIRAGDRRDGD